MIKSLCIYTKTVASVALMVGGAILNAAAFTGGNYLAKYLSGDSGQAALDEKIKALEAYQAAYAKYQKDRTELLDWIAANDRMKDKARHDSKIPTEHWPCTIKHTGQRWPFPKNPSFLTSTSPAHSRRMASTCLLVPIRLRLGMQPFASFKPIIHGCQTLKNLLQPQRLLERSCRCEKASCSG